MKPVVIFGTGKIAEVILSAIRERGIRDVVACTVDRAFAPGPVWEGLPVVPFEDVEKAYPPSSFDMFVALGYQEMNALRTCKCADARALGYTLVSIVDPASGMPTDCQIGDNCFVMRNTMIHPRVRLGNNVFVWSGAMIGHHSVVGDNCWLTSCANISGVVTVGANCFFAVNSTIGHGVKLGADCFFGANVLVTKSTSDGQVFVAESSKAFRLNSQQFLRVSRFADM